MVTALLYKIAQLFIFMIIGFIFVKCKIIKSDDSMVLSKMSVYLLIPAGIINSFDFDMTNDVASGFALALTASIIIHIIYFLLDKLYFKLGGKSAIERTSVMVPNAANLIIPIVSFVLGDEWVVYSTAFVSVQLLFFWSYCIKVFEPGEKFNFKKVIFNANTIAIIIGVILMVSPLSLPSIVKDVASVFSTMLGPVGMFVIGVFAATLDYKKVLGDKKLYVVVILRMVIYPIITLITVKLLSLLPVNNAEKILLITFLSTITPTATLIMQYSQIKGENTEFATAINIMTTLICIITMPIFVAFYNFDIKTCGCLQRQPHFNAFALIISCCFRKIRSSF